MAHLIGLASDHGGKELKKRIKDHFTHRGDIQINDLGVADDDEGSVDYPDYAKALAEEVSSGRLEKGIAICGTGLGMCITANKYPHVRATSVWNEYTALMSRQHNDANIICLGARILTPEEAIKLIDLWLKTPFEGGRHSARLAKIAAFEKKVRE